MTTSYILIDAETRAPVPLPLEVESPDGHCMAVVNFSGPTSFSESGYVFCKFNRTTVARHPWEFGLAIITEANFMAERNHG